MAELDKGSVGIQVLAGLPENNGLPVIAAELLDDPRPVYALVELRPLREVTNLETDSHTMQLRVVQIEPLSGAAADRMRDQLRKVREKRTGVVPLPGVDNAEVPPAGDAAPDGDLPTGPEWGDDTGGAATESVVPPEPVPTAAEDTQPVAAPPFATPTPIGQKRA